MNTIIVPANYYQQFDADRSLEFPGEGYGGWKKAELPLNVDSTAIVVMHAWDCGTWDEYPGWHRAVEYIPRSYEICERVFPKLLSAIRQSKLKLIHVVAKSHYYVNYPGYMKVNELSGIENRQQERVESDSVRDSLNRFKSEHVFPGAHNREDISRGRVKLDFPKEAKPIGDEPIAETSEQLFAYCKHAGINHLIYAGFAINGCLMLSPGGMVDMSKRGLMCSAIRQAVTAIENKETVRQELAKEAALWNVALSFGFVYDSDDLIKAILPD